MWSLDWFSAAEKARQGTPVRRVEWTDRWLVYQRGLWWIRLAATSRVVAATDITADDLLARDWTDELVSADVCGTTPAYNTAGVVYRTWGDEPIFTPPPVPGFPAP